MTPKDQIEAALNKAIWHVIAEHVVNRYMAETENPSMDAVPQLVAQAREIHESGH